MALGYFAITDNEYEILLAKKEREGIGLMYFGVMQTLNAWYSKCHNVSIDVSPMPRKYYKFGKNLFALSHDIRVKEALKIISSEAKMSGQIVNI